MSKFNTKTAQTARTYGTSVIQTETAPSGTTHEGALGWKRTPKSELFLLAVSDFAEDTFYETAETRAKRYKDLTAKVAVEDSAWVLQFVTWLRGTANMRSSSLMVALESARALLKAELPGGKDIVNAALQRADEPGEAVAYWHANYGRRIPQPIKRGIAKAARRLYTQDALYAYDTASHSVRFADVIQLTHVAPETPIQSALFKFALDRRYNKDAVPAESLSKASAREELKGVSGDELRRLANAGELTEYLRKAGMRWEALSSVISGGMDAKAWEAVIPVMGYMALIRNLRNFLEAGVSAPVLKGVAARIADPAEVAKSRQLPFRFWSAFKNTSNSTVFSNALEEGLNACLQNVPSLKGRTLVLIDNSGSMGRVMSGKSTVTMSEAAKLFGVALALRAEDAKLVEFGGYGRSRQSSGWGWGGNYTEEIKFKRGDSLLPTMKKFSTPGGGTYIHATLEEHYDKTFDRVIVVSDEQVMHEGSGPYSLVSKNTPVFVWNLGGYGHGSAPSGENIFTAGGLSDGAFGYVGLVESGARGIWPWDQF